MKKKLIIVFLFLFCISCFENEIIIHNQSLGNFHTIKDNGKYISILYTSPKGGEATAVLYDKSGNEILRLSDDNGGQITFAEFVPAYDYFLVVFRSWPSLKHGGEIVDRIRAINIHTGKTIWEAKGSGGFYEISPDGKYIITKIDFNEDNFLTYPRLFNLANGARINIDLPTDFFEVAWYDNERFIYVSNKTDIIEPTSVIDEQSKWNSLWEHKLAEKKSDLENNKISQAEFDKYKREAENEEYETNVRFSSSFFNETKHIYSSTIKIFHVVNNKVEIEKTVSSGTNDIFYVSAESSFSGKALFVDKEKNVYIIGVLNPDLFERGSYSIIKLNQSLGFIWKSDTLPQSSIVRYSINQKPYYGFFLNNEEFFVEPLRGALLPFKDVKKAFENIPSISSLVKYRHFYEYSPSYMIDLAKQQIILKNN